MERYFNRAIVLTGDCFVADYTKDSESKRGVVISEEPFVDIDFFHLEKVSKGNVNYLAVNLEEYPAFIKGIQNCECVFNSLVEQGKSWILFLELKYCDADNIEGYAFKAYSQMRDTLGKLALMQLVDVTAKNIYFVYASPGNNDKIPFGASVIYQNTVLQKYRAEGIQMLGVNRMLIATPQYLFQPKVAI